MISEETATAIALAHREIETAKGLLEKVEEQLTKDPPEDVRDVFGRSVNGLQLGVPSGERSHRCYTVSWETARPVIEAHIRDMGEKLEALNQKAAAEAAA